MKAAKPNSPSKCSIRLPSTPEACSGRVSPEHHRCRTSLGPCGGPKIGDTFWGLPNNDYSILGLYCLCRETSRQCLGTCSKSQTRSPGLRTFSSEEDLSMVCTSCSDPNCCFANDHLWLQRCHRHIPRLLGGTLHHHALNAPMLDQNSTLSQLNLF